MIMMSIDIYVNRVRVLNSVWQVEVHIHIRLLFSVKVWLLGITGLGFTVCTLHVTLYRNLDMIGVRR